MIITNEGYFGGKRNTPSLEERNDIKYHTRVKSTLNPTSGSWTGVIRVIKFDAYKIILQIKYYVYSRSGQTSLYITNINNELT